MDSCLDVLIVGAGPTGLTLAVELARRGVSFRLVDAAPGPRPGSRGKGLQPRTLEIFEDLGIAERILAIGRLAMPIRTTFGGEVTLGGDVPAALRDRPDIPYPASLLLPQWRVEEALLHRLTELGGAVQYGMPLQGFTQTEDVVTATFASETVTARWLVGCDGGHSVVRKQAGIAFEGETREEVRMLLADLEVDGLDRDTWHMWLHPEGLVTLCPLPSTNAFSFQAALPPDSEPALDRTSLQALLERRTGRDDIRLREPEWTSTWRANIRLVDRYREGRVFLAGDAAHIHSPAGGQGMNTGIQDAYNLGWKLAAVVKGARPALLDTYEAERRPIAQHVIALSNARLKQFAAQKEFKRDASTIQLDLNYRGSSLARDDRPESAPLRAGDRAPDATKLRTANGEHRLFELTRGGDFTLLSFGDASSPRVRTIRIPGDVVDGEGHLARAYGAVPGTLVLLRPDGYIALVSDQGDLDAVHGYLSALA